MGTSNPRRRFHITARKEWEKAGGRRFTPCQPPCRMRCIHAVSSSRIHTIPAIAFFNYSNAPGKGPRRLWCASSTRGVHGKTSMRVCIIGCGSIGSLYAAYPAPGAEGYAFFPPDEHALAINKEGVRLTWKHEVTSYPPAATN